MRVLGVVCEYNPFHRGHALHLLAQHRAGFQGRAVRKSGAIDYGNIGRNRNLRQGAAAAEALGANSKPATEEYHQIIFNKSKF